MNWEFVQVISTDKLILPGLLHTSNKSDRVAIYLHGNGDSGVFYQTKLHNALATELDQKGISYLAFNNRGARYKKNLLIAGSGAPGKEEKYPGGAHYELIEDCVHDIDGAIEFLRSKGFGEFYLLGYSTGANKICVYDYLKKSNEVSKYVHAGPGDDSGLFFNEIGEQKFKLSLKYAKQAIKAGNPLKVMPMYTGMNPFSAQSAYDILNPDGPYNTFPYFEATTKRLGKKELFNEYKQISKPQLVIFGEFDEFSYTGGGTLATLDLLKKHTHRKSLPNSSFQVTPGTDHGFHGKENESARQIADWLSS